MLSFVCLEFKIESKWIWIFQNLFSLKTGRFKNKLYQAVTYRINDYSNMLTQNIISVNNLQNSVQVLANELKRYITTSWSLWELEKPLSCLWRQKLKQSVSSVRGKLTTLGLFFVENKDWVKAEIGSKTFKNCKVIRAETPPLNLSLTLRILVSFFLILNIFHILHDVKNSEIRAL